MLESPDLKRVPLDDLAKQCAQQTERFRQRLEHDVRSCFEIFRRAIADSSERAWTIFADQYRFQIARWVQKHPGFAQCGENLDDLVAHVFSKLWLTFASNKDKILQFRNFQSLMAYCKMCVHSEVVDALRLRSSKADELTDAHVSSEPNSVEIAGLWDYILPRLKDEHERTVIQALFVYGMGPKDLLKRFPSRFSDVAEIYRIKQNVISRLRRDANFRKLFGQDD